MRVYLPKDQAQRTQRPHATHAFRTDPARLDFMARYMAWLDELEARGCIDAKGRAVHGFWHAFPGSVLDGWGAGLPHTRGLPSEWVAPDPWVPVRKRRRSRKRG